MTGAIILQLAAWKHVPENDNAIVLSLSDGVHYYSVTVPSQEISDDCVRKEFNDNDIFELVQYSVIQRENNW